jgi:hypothetical protein
MDSSRICSDDNLQAIDAMTSIGQEVLRGKVHLSHRCFALAAWNDFHLRRRQPCSKAINSFVEEHFLANSLLMLSKQIPEEPIDENCHMINERREMKWI